MREYIYDVLKLTAVECLADISLPDLGFVPEMLSEQLAILGMVKPELKVTNNFAPRGRNASDPPYSLDAFARAGVGIELRVRFLLGNHDVDGNLEHSLTRRERWSWRRSVS
jgi:hypothetical protein